MKYTVEERSDGTFIATYWDPTASCEHDRKVVEFETYSGALVMVLKLALQEAIIWTGLDKVETYE
jgi:hypothetical protein